MGRSLITSAVCAAALLAVPAAASAHAADRNHDGIPDRWERAHHLSLSVNQARRDQDHDGLNNRQEFRDHTNPRKADTDGDGLKDGAEIRTGNNPLVADSNGNGIPDGQENAGSVVSFDTTTMMLTIRSGSQDITAPVTSDTEIKCEGMQSPDTSSGNTTAQAADHGSGSGDNGDQGDNNQNNSNDNQGVDNSGDQNSAQSNSSGDQSNSSGDASGNANDQADDNGNDQGDDNGNDQGDDNGNDQGDDNGQGDNNGANCTTADLQPGAVVNEAELQSTSTGFVWREVKLVK